MTVTRQWRVFLAAPFTQLIGADTGTVDAGWRNQIGALYDALRGRGYSVFLAHDREAWGEGLMTPSQCTPLDHKEMVNADVVCAYPGAPPSYGVHVELGWASAMGKPLLLLLDAGTAYSPLLSGIGEVTRADFFALRGRRLDEVAHEVGDRVAAMLAELPPPGGTGD
jgi:nucleoside 2-deoxyribosyltransferase